MIEIICYGLLGFWVGYMLRRFVLVYESTKMTAKIFSVVVCIGVLVAFISAGASPRSSGTIALGAAFGAYLSLSKTDAEIQKLRNTWAGVWLFVLFLVLEGARETIVLSKMPVY